MPIKEVQLSGTLNLQDDEYAIGLNGFVSLVNLRQQNGKLVQRYGTGSPTTLSSKNIDNMEIFVDRKLQAVKIAAGTCNVEFDHSEKRINLSDMAGVDIPGFADTDLRAVFKAGDTIYIDYDGTSANEGVYIIESVVDADTLEVNRGFNGDADETLNSGTVTIGFSYADYNDTAPKSILAADDNSFDGRAWITSYTNTNKFLSLVSPLDYTDNIDLEDFQTGSGDMFIRPKAYTDAVRIACGLEHSPRIFKYVNRHHFNGILKSVYNSHADLLYPRWVIDKTVPTVTANTFTLEEAKLDDNNGEESASAPYYGIRYIKGGLDLLNNQYEWIFVPVYDGNQEGLLEESLLTLNTGDMSIFGGSFLGPTIEYTEVDFPLGFTVNIPSGVSMGDINTSAKILKGSTLSLQTISMLSTLKIDLTKLNPRMSGINVYRKTNNGTPYKVKSIYMGDNDVTQKTITDAYNETDRIWWTGGTDLSGGGGSDGSFTDLDSAILMNNSEAFTTDNGTGWNNFQSTNCRSVEINAALDGTVNEVGKWYGDRAKGTKLAQSHFNKVSEETETIFGGDDSFTGGSLDGGWYFAHATEHATGTFLSHYEPGDEPDGDMNNHCGDYDTGKPFNYNSTSGADFRFSNPGVDDSGDNTNEAGVAFDINEAADLSGNYIISGWIRAVGLNHRDSRWNFVVHTAEDLTDFDAQGTMQIASGLGSENANMPWVYFQRTITGLSSNSLFGYVWINTPDSLTGSDTQMFVQIWGLSLRQEISNYTLSDKLRGFMGHDVMVSSDIEDLDVPAGALKGNRIQDDTTAAYPVNVDTDRTYISDNYGQFIRTCGWVPGLVATDNNKDNFLLSSSNYQFYSNGSDNTNQYMLLDFLDTGLPDGARHPNETATSTDVKFKHATMLNGRQFVGNVKITSDEDIEEYPNFVMFSEANAPDIIPTTNFIQLQDLQGGEIVGIESLMSDIVVFMTNGIFRLSVPSNNPHNWSLVEAHKNVGALHDKGIVKTDNGIFFLSRSDIYFLDSGFNLKPISDPIRDSYQSKTNPGTSLRLHHNIKENYLYLLWFVATQSVFYVYDLNRGVWYQETHKSLSYGYDELSIDNLGESILIESDTHSLVRKLHDTTSFQDAGSVAVEWIMKTGKQILNSLDMNAILRRVNTIVTHNASATDNDISITTDAGTTTKTDFLDGIQSSRISKRGKYIQIQIDSEANEDYQHEINHVDVEYE